MGRYWKNTPQYRRILEVLEDYWITEPDEAAVVVDIHFLHKTGAYQNKYITWLNPNIQWPVDEVPEIVSADQMLDMVSDRVSCDKVIDKRANQLKEMRK